MKERGDPANLWLLIKCMKITSQLITMIKMQMNKMQVMLFFILARQFTSVLLEQTAELLLSTREKSLSYCRFFSPAPFSLCLTFLLSLPLSIDLFHSLPYLCLVINRLCVCDHFHMYIHKCYK